MNTGNNNNKTMNNYLQRSNKNEVSNTNYTNHISVEKRFVFLFITSEASMKLLRKTKLKGKLKEKTGNKRRTEEISKDKRA